MPLGHIPKIRETLKLKPFPAAWPRYPANLPRPETRRLGDQPRGARASHLLLLRVLVAPKANSFRPQINQSCQNKSVQNANAAVETWIILLGLPSPFFPGLLLFRKPSGETAGFCNGFTGSSRRSLLDIEVMRSGRSSKQKRAATSVHATKKSAASCEVCPLILCCLLHLACPCKAAFAITPLVADLTPATDRMHAQGQHRFREQGTPTFNITSAEKLLHSVNALEAFNKAWSSLIGAHCTGQCRANCNGQFGNGLISCIHIAPYQPSRIKHSLRFSAGDAALSHEKSAKRPGFPFLHDSCCCGSLEHGSLP